MSHGHGQFRNMGNFKALALDYEFWLSNSTDSALYCLNQRDISILLALCEYVGWFTRWVNTEDTSAAEIRAIQGELTLKLMECVDISVLIEQMQQLVDQGELNLTYQVVNNDIQSQALRDILEDRYDGTPTSINPDAPTGDFGGLGDRDTALCAAITAFVYQFAHVQADHVRAAQVGGLLAAAAIAGLLIPGLNIFLLVAASIAVVAGAGVIGVTTETAIEALTDTGALDNVVCCMVDNLKTAAVSQASFEASLDGCSFSVGSHEQIVADFITPTLTQNYLTILNMLGQGYSSVVGGQSVPECPCDPDPQCETYEYTAESFIITVGYVGLATINVISGQSVTIRASGDYTYYAPIGTVGPDGLPIAGHGYDPSDISGGTQRQWCLLYRVGTSGAWLPTSTEVTFSAGSSDTLYLATNLAVYTGSGTGGLGDLVVEVCAELEPLIPYSYGDPSDIALVANDSSGQTYHITVTAPGSLDHLFNAWLGSLRYFYVIEAHMVSGTWLYSDYNEDDGTLVVSDPSTGGHIDDLSSLTQAYSIIGMTTTDNAVVSVKIKEV